MSLALLVTLRRCYLQSAEVGDVLGHAAAQRYVDGRAVGGRPVDRERESNGEASALLVTLTTSPRTLYSRAGPS